MFTTRLIVHGIATALFILAIGCGGRIPESQETETTPPPAAPPQQRIEFETKTDTVAMEHTGSVVATENRNREIRIKYMIQIGAFKDPRNASMVQATARQRYRQPVLNDFHTAYGLYQIRIGFFETKDDAYKFRARIQQDFPPDYKDAWVVQLKR